MTLTLGQYSYSILVTFMVSIVNSLVFDFSYFVSPDCKVLADRFGRTPLLGWLRLIRDYSYYSLNIIHVILSLLTEKSNLQGFHVM